MVNCFLTKVSRPSNGARKLFSTKCSRTSGYTCGREEVDPRTVLSRPVMSGSATSWTVARRALPPMEFSRQEYWSGLPCPLPGDLSNLGIKLASPALQADSLLSESPDIHLAGNLLIFKQTHPNCFHSYL